VTRLQSALNSLPQTLDDSSCLRDTSTRTYPPQPLQHLSHPAFTLPPLRLPAYGFPDSTPRTQQVPTLSYTNSHTDLAPLPFSPNHTESSTSTAIPTAPPLPSSRKRRRRNRDRSPSASSSDEHEQQSLITSQLGLSLHTWQASVALTPQFDCAALTAAASRFQYQLQHLQISEKKNNTLVTSQIHPTDITALTRFFFHDVFGEGCQKRMFSLLDALVQESQNHKSTATLAAERASDSTLPSEVQDFFADYSRWHIGEVKHVGVRPTVANTLRSFELYNSFFQLREKAAGPSGQQLQEFLKVQGFSRSVGVDIRTCILKYLSRELDITTSQLNNALQAQQGIFQLAQQFGKGILVLLPKVASHRYVVYVKPALSGLANLFRITRMGTQKMQRVTQILFDTLPEAVETCSAAELLIPYIQDDLPSPLPLFLGQQVMMRPRLSLLETVTMIRSVETTPVLVADDKT
jgi:hypothetical protein